MSISQVLGFPRLPFHFRLRHCDRCFKTNSRFQCAGCHAVVYCSKECQKAAWREHKSTCASQSNADRNLQASHLGYVSSLSLINAFEEWMEIRRWCLYNLMCALVQLEGGIDAILGGDASAAPVSRKALILLLVPVHRANHDGNPSLAFRLGHASITDKDSDDFLRMNWEHIKNRAQFVTMGTVLLSGLLNSKERDDLVAPAGRIPVLYMVHGTDIVNPHAFTLYHLPLRYLDGNLRDAPDVRTRAACEELVAIMKDLLDKPLLFQRPEDRQRPEPEWGVYGRTGAQKKRWKWMQLTADQKSWRLWEKLTDEAYPGRTSCLTPRQVLMFFDFRPLMAMR